MASGYLGKISAIVSANTGNYVRGLNESAAATRRFSKTIQDDLRRASTQATRAVDGILTPLQRVERALQNAGARGLRFRGFDGAIRTVEELSRRLASIEDQGEIALAVRISGLDNITQLKSIVSDLREEEVELAVNVGGVAGLERLRADIQEVNGTPINVQTGISARRLDELIAKFRQLSPQRLRALGEGIQSAQFERASASFQRLIGFSEGVAASFTRASQQFAQLSAGIQTGFGPAFRNITDELQQFSEQLQRTDAAASAFDEVASRAQRAEQAIARLVEVQKLASSGARGTELGFVAPDVQRVLSQSAAVRDRAASVEDPRQFAAAVRRSSQQAELVAQRQAEVESARRVGNPQQIEAAVTRLNQAIETARRLDAALASSVARVQSESLEGLIQREQREKRLAGQLASDAERRAKAEIDGLIQREQREKRLADQLAADAERREKSETDALIQRERRAKRINDQLAAAQSLTPAGQRQRAADEFLSRGGAGAQGLALGIDRRQLQGVAAEIDIIQNRLSRVSAEARGPAVAALERYRQTVVAAFQDGSIATDQGRQKIEQARNAVISLTAAAAKVSARRLAQELNRAGDIARGSFGNIQLAVQQAAFAVDDFFSVTGDLSQRIRAVGNNLSQLGFILAGTEGLIAGVAFSLTVQGIAALVRWATAADAASESTKVLNEALRSQQNAVTSLADAYARLAKEIERAGRSGFLERSSTREERVRDLRRIAEERVREEITQISPDVANIRGARGILERRLEGTSNLNQRLRIQSEIDRNRRQEQAAIARGVAAPGADEVQGELLRAQEELVRQTQVRLNRAAARARRGGAAVPGEDAVGLQAELAQRQQELAARRAGGGPRQPGEQLTQLRQILAGLESQRERVVASGARTTEIDSAIDGVVVSIRRIEASLAPAVLDITDRITRSSLSAADTLSESVQVISEILADSPEARRLRGVLAETASEVSRLQTAAGAATTPEEARRIEGQIGAQRARAQELRVAAQAAAAAVAVDPQSLFGSIAERARQNLQGADSSSGVLARALRQLEATRERLISNLDAEDPNLRAGAEILLPDVNAQAAALEAATLRVNRFAEAIGRAEQEVQSDVQSARQRADQARRADIRFGTAYTARDRQRAEADLREQQEAARDAERVFRLERDRLERGVGPQGLAAADDFRRLRDIDERIASGDTTREERERLEEERRQINARIDAQVAASPEVQQARDAAARVAEQQALRQRGEELLLTPGERGARDLTESLAAVRAAFEARVGELGGPLDQRGLAEAEQRLIREEQARVAPLVAQFADEVQNAVLQGPSRAALGATDASTLQGQSELNRLIRGDDPARDVNLLELQKQTQELRILNARLNLPVAGA